MVDIIKHKNVLNHPATIQTLVLGALLTVAYLSANMVGIHDFSTTLYVSSMLIGFGVVGLPAAWGGKQGSLGPLAIISFGVKIVGLLISAGAKNTHGS
jgi:hypothetical protein